MKADNIRVGQVLAVKASARENAKMPDGSEVPAIIAVERITRPAGRKTPWVYAQGGAFRPAELDPIS